MLECIKEKSYLKWKKQKYTQSHFQRVHFNQNSQIMMLFQSIESVSYLSSQSVFRSTCLQCPTALKFKTICKRWLQTWLFNKRFRMNTSSKIILQRFLLPFVPLSCKMNWPFGVSFSFEWQPWTPFWIEIENESKYNHINYIMVSHYYLNLFGLAKFSLLFCFEFFLNRPSKGIFSCVLLFC